MKKYLLLLSVLLCLTLLLCGCFKPAGPSTDKEDKKIQVVYSDVASYGECAVALAEKMQSYTDYEVSFCIDSFEEADVEIILGETNRALSETAYSRLSRVDKENSENVAYVIYSDGKSVAIAFEEDKYGIDAALMCAIEYFVENYVDGKSAPDFKEGELFKDDVDPIEYQRALDVAKRNHALDDAVRAIEDKELASSLRRSLEEFFNLMSADGSAVVWLANLYDPKIGGFYYSNSARDTEGFLPDIESTGQALTFISCCGIFDYEDDSLPFPDKIRQDIAKFVKPLQDPNGYFYHPQWGKKLTDTMVERRARDLSWALSCLSFSGARPTYDTPTGALGDGLLVDGTRVDSSGNVVKSSGAYLPMGLGSRSEAIMVSRAILASDDYVSPALLNDKTFKAYLEEGNIRKNGYGFGSEISSQTSEIIYRDKQLKAEGADYSLCDILVEYLNQNQNPDNGVWYWVDKSDPSYSYYAGVNGLLKISGIYTAVGEEFPNAIAASKTAIEAIYSNEDPAGIVDIYNAWYAIENIIKNLRACASDKDVGEENIRNLRNELLNDAPEALMATARKLALFKKLDGSFSYLQKSSAPWSSGMRVAVPNTNEGDVNATIIGGLDTSDRMFSVLGLRVPEFYGKADWCRFIDTIQNLNPVIKDPEPEVAPLEFDYDDVGAIPSSVTVTNGSATKIEVVADPRGEGNVLRFASESGKNDSVAINSASSALANSCFVFDTDMCVVSGESGYAVQISFSEAYMLCLRLDATGVNLFDSSSSSVNKIDVDFCHHVPYGEWFNLRVEYYAGDHNSVRIKVLVNGKVIAVSDNYFDYYGKKILNGEGIPDTAISGVKLFAMKSSEFEMLLDNMLVKKTKDTYAPYTDPENQPIVNVDSPDREEIVYDFEDRETGGALPEEFTVKKGGDKISITEISDDKKLSLKGGTGFNINIPVNPRVSKATCDVFEADIDVLSAKSGELLNVVFREMSYYEERITGFKLIYSESSDGGVLALYESADGKRGAKISGTEISASSTVKLRIEYYSKEKATIVYINGKIVALNSAVAGGAEKFTVGKIELSSESQNNFTVGLDNVRAEKIKKDFNKAVEPEIDRVTHSFDTIDASVILNGSAKLVNDGIGKALSLGKETGSCTVPINVRSEVSSIVYFSAGIFIPEDAGKNQNERIAFIDKDGNTVLAYELRMTDGKVGIHEFTELKTYSEPVGYLEVGRYVTLTIEYFVAREIVRISLDGQIIAESSLLFNASARSKTIEKVRISHQSGVAVKLDDAVLESLNGLFVAKSLDDDNSEDGSEVLTFEDSTSGNLPSSLKVSLKSGGSAVKVKELGEDGELSKSLVLETSSGGIDVIKMSSSNKTGSFDRVVFESRLMCDSVGSLYLFFLDADGKQCFRINVNIDGNSVRIDDNSGLGASYGYGTMGNPSSGKAVGEWFDLRIEFVNPDGKDIVAKIYVNGKHFATSTEKAWAGKLALDIASVEITTSSSASGSFAFDDLSLGKGSSLE